MYEAVIIVFSLRLLNKKTIPTACTEADSGAQRDYQLSFCASLLKLS